MKSARRDHLHGCILLSPLYIQVRRKCPLFYISFHMLNPNSLISLVKAESDNMVIEEGQVVRCDVKIGVCKGDEHCSVNNTICRSFVNNTAWLDGSGCVCSGDVE